MVRNTALRAILLLEAARFSFSSPATTDYDNALVLRSEDYPITSTAELAEPRGMDDHHHDVVEEPKSKPWLGYYDFLITEGSYKFWVVFELFTCALLIYSAFAAIYYAKYTVTDYDYDDYFFKKRSARSIQQEQSTFLGLPVETYLRIFEAISDLNHKYS